MARTNDPDSTVEVRKVPLREKGAKVGKPTKIITSSMRSKIAFPATGGSTMGVGGNFYSPELSTDFLELPQSDDEKRNFYRFFYDHDPFAGQAVDLLDELPLSKVRLRMPEARNRKVAEASLRFCERWAKKIGLLHRLMEISHEWNLLGEAFIFCEDTSPDMSNDVQFEVVREITAEGEIVEKAHRRPDADDRALTWLKKNYHGWSAVRTLPPEQIQMESFPFTDEKLIELIPDSKTKAVINRAQQGDEHAARVVRSMPADVVVAITEGRNIPLNTDPDAGSFVHYMARKKSQYEARGKSILGRCLLPGTPIWIERNGVVKEVSVEQVNDRTDLLLTHQGRFRPCKAGSRPVAEDIVHLAIEGFDEPLRLTADHEVLRVQEDGTEEWIEAGDLREGDLVREAYVVPEGRSFQIDLAEWWRNRSLLVTKRSRPRLGLGECSREIQVQEVTVKPNPGLAVMFTHENDNRNRARALPGLDRLIGWACSLSESVVLTQAEVARAAGVSERDVRVYVPRLRKKGLIHTEAKFLGRGRGQATTWFPATSTQMPLIKAMVTSPVTKIKVTEDFCYLLGTWLGDGCVWTDSNFLNAHSVGWSLHEPDLRDRVVKLVQDIFGGFATGCLKDPSSVSVDIRIEDSLLARWFMEEFGHTAQGKYLPRWVFDLPDEHVKALLRGLLDTDGYLRPDGSYLSFEMANQLLVGQVHLLCNRIGWQTQTRRTIRQARSWTRTWQSKSGLKTKTYDYPDTPYWNLSCSRSPAVCEWSVGTVKGIKAGLSQHSQTPQPKANKFMGGWLTRRVRAVEVQRYQGVVYSFDVGTDHTHVTGIVTHNCLRTLIFRDKVRQSLTSIASRHMTPCRLIYAEDMNAEQTEDLREQVDLALQDPDFSIITNFQVTWEEMGADQRLPDWSWVFDHTNQLMYAGLGMTESLLSGESSYSGDRIHLEVINTRFMLMREVLQDLVENYFFKPMCARMGFVEEDEDGNLDVVVPSLSFTRLALRDNNETFDALFNLYQKGSLDIDTILDLLNLDPVTVKEKLQRDFATVNDATFNEVLRGMYTSVGTALGDNSDLAEKIAERLGLKYEKPKEEGAGRF